MTDHPDKRPRAMLHLHNRVAIFHSSRAQCLSIDGKYTHKHCAVYKPYPMETKMAYYAQSRIHTEQVLAGFQGLSLGTLFATLKTWNDERITRRELSALSDRELADVGLCRGDIESVAKGRF